MEPLYCKTQTKHVLLSLLVQVPKLYTLNYLKIMSAGVFKKSLKEFVIRRGPPRLMVSNCVKRFRYQAGIINEEVYIYTSNISFKPGLKPLFEVFI